MRRPNWKNVISASIFGSILVGLGLWGTLSNGGRVYYAVASKAWPSTSGIVQRSAVTREPMDSTLRQEEMQGDYSSTMPKQGEGYRLHFGYRYTVDGREYQGGRVAFSFSSTGHWIGPIAISNPKKKSEAVVAQYPVGTGVTVYYQPGNPSRATLRTGGFTGQYVLFTILCLPVLLLGCGVLLYTWIRLGDDRGDSRQTG